VVHALGNGRQRAAALDQRRVSAIRPTSGTTNYVFTVTLAYASLNTVNVSYATADGSARSTFDYQSTAGGLTFPVSSPRR
jgi:hypothetical protein